MLWLMISVLAICGALLRYFVGQIGLGASFPWAILSVNTVGSFLMGGVYALNLRGGWLSTEWLTAISVGFLGSLTTFSTYSLDTLKFFQSGQLALAFGNFVLSNGLCFVACALGFRLSNSL